MYRTGPKMGFRSPKGEKKCQKWIEQAQNASESQYLKLGRHPLFGYFYGGYPRGYQKRGYPGITANTKNFFEILKIFNKFSLIKNML